MVYADAMYNWHRKMQTLPQGIPANPWVNLLVLLVFTPVIIVFVGFVLISLWAIGDVLYQAVFK